MFGELPELLIVISRSPGAAEPPQRQGEDLVERDVVGRGGQQRGDR